jgi:hypothetical protein
MEGHISECHVLEKQTQARRTAKDMYKAGAVQRFFTMRTGSSFFRVNPILSGVTRGSDFDIWFASLSEVDREQSLSTAAVVGDGDEGIEMDLSPFLANVGWTRHLEGYSWRSLAKQTTIPLAAEKSYLHQIPKLALAYFKSMSQEDVTSVVHPTNMKCLNSWKRCVLTE